MRSPALALTALLCACAGDDGGESTAGTSAGTDGSSGTTGATDSTAGSTSGTSTSSGSAGSSSSGTTTATAGTSTTTGSASATTSATTTDTGGGVWSPAPGTSWQWQLTETIDTSVDVAMYDIDLFDVPAGTISGLQGQGRVVICYFSAGSYEEWRDDAGDFPQAALGNPLDGWPGERWLDVRHDGVEDVMAARLDLAVQKGCDGVEPDNVDGYQNSSGFPLTGNDQLAYNTWLAAQAHARGLSIGLKNDLDQVAALEPLFDWALNEECVTYNECDMLAPFVDAGKAVFHTEYVDTQGQGQAAADSVCPAVNGLEFSTLIKTWDLDAWRIACP